MKLIVKKHLYRNYLCWLICYSTMKCHKLHFLLCLLEATLCEISSAVGGCLVSLLIPGGVEQYQNACSTSRSQSKTRSGNF